MPSSQTIRNVDWDDPGVPAGDSPPLARWPLAVSAVLWVAWLGFLVVTALKG